MYAIEILLPLYDNEGRRFGQQLYGEVRRELMERFGGLTAFTRSPAEGLWESEEGETARDEIVIFEVMTDWIDRGWWTGFRHRLEQAFAQDEIAVRAREFERL